MGKDVVRFGAKCIQTTTSHAQCNGGLHTVEDLPSGVSRFELTH
jgi:hypothetical protein